MAADVDITSKRPQVRTMRLDAQREGEVVWRQSDQNRYKARREGWDKGLVVEDR